ncbi:hypothetical protein GYMLUDRAFT_244803 [Collybiopsis luxurians FD-317 M1]|uniref:Mid2 domain-containing protein n=1 Tax=Collybiopsis luxurians FD-317 M1 TaxID=944289 RepID=A0A0D0B900_9AGAR|nr:hypothetical protein GYMLUDRAFT_244803 [Collybiopsis luxurians FD-317 M1]
MRSLTLFFLSFCTFAAGFNFTGIPSTATVNETSFAKLIIDSGDPTSFSLLLRNSLDAGGEILDTFQSVTGTGTGFGFKPTQTGIFMIEVISNLQPISENQEPDNVFAASSTFNVVAANETQSSSNGQSFSTTASATATDVPEPTSTVSALAGSSSLTVGGSSMTRTESTSVSLSTIPLASSTSAAAGPANRTAFVAGGVGGGLGLLLLLAIILLCFRRRSIISTHPMSGMIRDNEGSADGAVSPFVVNHLMSLSKGKNRHKAAEERGNTQLAQQNTSPVVPEMSRPSPQSRIQRTRSIIRIPMDRPMGPFNNASDESPGARTRERSGRVGAFRHQDSGWRDLPLTRSSISEETVELPPEYSSV